MAVQEWRVTWRRAGWRSESSKTFGRFATVERHLERLDAAVDNGGAPLSPAVWRVDVRDVSEWREVQRSSPGAPVLRPSRALAESRVVSTPSAPYDPPAACRAAVVAALADGMELSLSGLRAAVRMRHGLVASVASALAEEGVLLLRPGSRGARMFSLADPSDLAGPR